jgi:hypothetical protein
VCYDILHVQYIPGNAGNFFYGVFGVLRRSIRLNKRPQVTLRGRGPVCHACVTRPQVNHAQVYVRSCSCSSLFCKP